MKRIYKPAVVIDTVTGAVVSKVYKRARNAAGECCKMNQEHSDDNGEPLIRYAVKYVEELVK